MNAAHRPRKRFGQNFLHDPGSIERILAAIDPQPGQALVEIGPGRGALTWQLLERLGRLEVIELDRDLCARLDTERHAHPGELIIHSADALKTDFCGLEQPPPLRVVGNLPYNISTPLLFHLLGQAGCIRDMHFLLQKEVVERMAAAPGGRDYGRLSVMLQMLCEVEPLFTVGPGAFHPPPKVDSACVRLIPLPTPRYVIDPDTFADRTRLAFAHRRKTLRNNLKGELHTEQLEAAGIDPGRRAETLSLEEFARLSTLPSGAE
ncbi:16S rRNA (adenine(1518)-N(6)/adenine(1519)-N(6))-dimethyltransferase RsmA [Thiohalobacter thiocyanaticus]|uniref:Ribosomal RNA small subunit methyltransferase A n=1 Tax=Thiohalobacter thiocyanaticus TaxID=585455 RepID=A0A426QKR2_9GAMM|nr:16S rRNA (adenine(1518)-N(6)/adenine(1519)-N(6))-dimethyltransferase RsmA [Thiohalobacter thiocyanaticus]RRQ22330.1 16S rRNA (adenine(1518)-N(6)/adenine(1519)-N(6))-dimethyltransferase RsmA [Thiohalobacter thiocyanaticus]